MSCNTKKVKNFQFSTTSPQDLVTVPSSKQVIVKHISVTDTNTSMATDRNGNCVDIIINDSDGIGDIIYHQAVEVPWGSSVTPLMGYINLEESDKLKIQPHKNTRIDVSIHYIEEDA